eukprot:4619058-Pyramimonas_sp.AAC.1
MGVRGARPSACAQSSGSLRRPRRGGQAWRAGVRCCEPATVASSPSCSSSPHPPYMIIPPHRDSPHPRPRYPSLPRLLPNSFEQ